MKKLLYIVIAVLALGFTSCNKEVVKPVVNDNASEPVWESQAKRGSERGATSEDPIVSPTNGGSITDPNSDEDESRKKKH